MAISADHIADTLERFVRQAFRIRPGDPFFARDAHLYDSGIVDSTGVVELIAFVETAFGVKLEDEHVFTEAFTTIDGISGVVHACLVAETDERPVAAAAGE
jgi:acyl carrier protein